MKTKNYILGVAALVAIGGGSFYFIQPLVHHPSDPLPIATVERQTAPALSIEEIYPNIIESGETLSSALQDVGAPPALIPQLVAAAKPVRDLTRIVPGWRFNVTKNQAGEIDGIHFRLTAVDLLDLVKTGEKWEAHAVSIPTETRLVDFAGTVTSSLWESAETAKMDASLITDLAEIFAFEVDFARAVRVNDSWKLTVEEKLVNGAHYTWGRITRATFINSGQPHEGILFRNGEEVLGYFAPDGSNLKKMFLKSPLRFGRISSRFNKARFHPILQVARPHLGVDYAAPVGTPIRAVGAGRIEIAGRNGGAGNMIRIRHNGTYETAYKHLSRIATGLHAGSRVEQGQTIGYVGSTGLSTGPHLHYEFYIAGRFVDPLSAKFPSGEPIPTRLQSQFSALVSTLKRDRAPAQVLPTRAIVAPPTADERPM